MTQTCSRTNFDDQSAFSKMMDGGIGYGTVCLPAELPKYIIMVIFPPLYVIMDQYKKGFPRFDKIIVSIVLTSLFYFPGLLHALSIIECGAYSDSTTTDEECSE
tara:strand:+ start:307 stop:618 length:312 start_codon:yes stop_codon:yes gene_type:complete